VNIEIHAYDHVPVKEQVPDNKEVTTMWGKTVSLKYYNVDFSKDGIVLSDKYNIISGTSCLCQCRKLLKECSDWLNDDSKVCVGATVKQVYDFLDALEGDDDVLAKLGVAHFQGYSTYGTCSAWAEKRKKEGKTSPQKVQWEGRRDPDVD
jgi:hypothetical protein